MYLISRLIWLLALFGAVWAVRRLFSGAPRTSQSGNQPRSVPDRGEGDMVRDRVCNTFLPRSRALILTGEAGEQFFCSERCREIHLGRKAG